MCVWLYLQSGFIVTSYEAKSVVCNGGGTGIGLTRLRFTCAVMVEMELGCIVEQVLLEDDDCDEDAEEEMDAEEAVLEGVGTRGDFGGESFGDCTFGGDEVMGLFSGDL